jgi:uncharacterized membrane protein YgcG
MMNLVYIFVVVCPLVYIFVRKYKHYGQQIVLNNEAVVNMNRDYSRYNSYRSGYESAKNFVNEATGVLEQYIVHNGIHISNNKFTEAEKTLKELSLKQVEIREKLDKLKKKAQPILAERKRLQQIQDRKNQEARRIREEKEEQEFMIRKKKQDQENEERRKKRRQEDEEDERRRRSSYSSDYGSSSDSFGSSSSSWGGDGGSSGGGGSSDSW